MCSRVGGFSSCRMQASLPHGMRDLSSPTRAQTLVPCIGRRILNHWTTREVPKFGVYILGTRKCSLPNLSFLLLCAITLIFCWVPTHSASFLGRLRRSGKEFSYLLLWIQLQCMGPSGIKPGIKRPGWVLLASFPPLPSPFTFWGPSLTFPGFHL